MRCPLFFRVAISCLFMVPVVAIAQTPTTAPSAILEVPSVTAQAKLFYAEIISGKIDRTHLSAALNNALTPTLESSVAQQLSPLGTPQWDYAGGISAAGGPVYVYRLTYTNGTILYYIFGVDSHGTVTTMYIGPNRPPGLPPPAPGSATQPLSALRSLPGSVSYLVLKNGQPLFSYHQDKALGVGSSFKLAVLNALLQEIERGEHHWTDVVLLKQFWKSLPSGVYQDWPTGTALTLQTLATEMISVSDNTAADALADIVGPNAIAPFAGTNEPFLTTRDMFILKSKEGAALRAAYLRGHTTQRRVILNRLSRMPLPALTDLDTDPALSVIEWHYTNQQLCELMAGVEGLPLMSVNPGITDATDWKRVSYKGGSDWGVISMTTWLVSRTGTAYCVSATWNNSNAQVDDEKFEALYDALVASLSH